MMSTRFGNPIRILAILMLVAVLAAAPSLLGAYAVALLRDALLFSILAIGLDFLWGKTGVLSFGHAAFFGAGAYGVAIISTRFGIDPAYASWIGLIAGIGIAIAVSLVVGYFLIFGGVRGPYFTIVTLALAVITDHIIVGWSQVTGGNAGLLGVLPLVFPGSDGAGPLSPNGQFRFVLGIVFVLALGLWWLCRGRYGSLLRAIEDNETRAQALGHNTSLHILMVFVASAAMAALGGGLYASTVGFVAPDIVGLLLSTQAIVWVAIGGRGTIIGPIVATIGVIWLEQTVSSIDTKLWPLVIGGLFILAVFVFPNGIFAGLSKLFRPRALPSPRTGGGVP
jgi:ABC-type branched-subunit amino acid transport system permease subunit